MSATLRILGILVFLVFFVLSEAQTIQGVLIDGETGRPLERALVFIDNTTIGARTSQDGQFTISYRTGQEYANLVFAGMGYEIEKRSIDEFRTNFVDTVFLKEEKRNTRELVAIDADQWRLREERLKRFRKLMVG